jgi:D-sedoheptulose 7-phosphate isomerase
MPGMEGLQLIEQQLREAAQVLNNFLGNPQNLEQIEQAAHLMAQSLQGGNKILSCGNGGSHCDAMHFAEELTGKYREERRPLAALAIADPSHMSCTANDYGFEHIFSRYLQALGQKGDVLLAISTSGNSPNVVEALRAAGERGVVRIGLTGAGGGEMDALCEHLVRVPSAATERIQESHITVIHIFCELVERELFGS